MWHYNTDHMKTLIFNLAEFHKVTAFSGDLSCVSLTVLLRQGLMEDTACWVCHELVRAWLCLGLLGTEKCIRASSSEFSLNSNSLLSNTRSFCCRQTPELTGVNANALHLLWIKLIAEVTRSNLPASTSLGGQRCVAWSSATPALSSAHPLGMGHSPSRKPSGTRSCPLRGQGSAVGWHLPAKGSTSPYQSLELHSLTCTDKTQIELMNWKQSSKFFKKHLWETRLWLPFWIGSS